MPQTVQVEGHGAVEFPDDATPQEIEQALNESFPKEAPKTSAAGAFGISLAKGILPAFAARTGGRLGTALGMEAGPGALATGVAGAIGASTLADVAQNKLIEAVAPGLAKYEAEAQQEHPIASAAGGLLSGASAFKLQPLRGATALPALLKGTATEAEKEAAMGLGATAGLGAATGVVAPLVQGQAPTPRSVLEGAAQALIYGEPRTGKKGISDAQRIRSDTGLVDKTGVRTGAGEADRGSDVEQAPPAKPQPVEPGKEAAAKAQIALDPEKTGPLKQAAFKDPTTGQVYYGQYHLEAVRKAPNGEELAKQYADKESRNTPDFGYGTDTEPFVPRDQAGPIAKHWKQDLAGFDEAKPHTDTVAAKPGGATPMAKSGDLPIQAGAARAEGEILTGTALKNATGELERLGVDLPEAYPKVVHNMAQRWAKAGEVDAKNPDAGKKLAEDLMANPERGLSDDDSALLLRYKQKLINRMNDAAERTHTGDAASRKIAEAEHTALKEEFTQFLDTAKFRGSEWGREGRWRRAMVKEDYTFDSVDNLERYRQSLGKKVFTPEQKTQADKVSKPVKAAADAADKADQAMQAHIKAKGTGGMSAAEKRALDTASKVVREWDIKLANAETKKRVADVEAKQALEKVQADAKAMAEKAGSKETIESAIRKAREANKARVAKAERNQKQAQSEIDRAQKAKAAIAEFHKKAAIKSAERARKLQADPILRVWTKAKEYLDKGVDDFNTIRSKVATDLGMSTDQVTRLMAQDKRAKYLADDLWLKQQNERRLKEQARRWVTNLDVPGYMRAIGSIPRAMFSLKVGFHGTVALGTHAPTVAFQPRFWKTYVQDFGRMYRLVGKPTPEGQRNAAAYYESQIQDLMRRKNYATAKRAGLINDPFQFEEYHVGDLAGKVATISPKVAEYFNKVTGMGNRGYSVLKILRQDMFDQQWNKLPKSAQIPETAAAIAKAVNHSTGVVKGFAPKAVGVALFAPRLEASRFMWLVADPAIALKTFANWKNASTGERHFAINQVKEKAWVMGTMMSMLAINQGVLSATGSKQKINGIPESLGGAGFDPMESDFLKFKVSGMAGSYGNAMLAMARLPVRMATAIMFEGKTSKLILEDERVYKVALDYVRTQLSPFAGTATDLAFGRDYSGRPIPRKLFGLVEGAEDVPKRLKKHGVEEPFTWPEYGIPQLAPIPIAEAIKEVWEKGLGMSPDQVKQTMKAFATLSFMAGTGGRLNPDWREEE